MKEVKADSFVRHGRKAPYTAIGITRLPCFRCGEKAFSQWQVCADKGTYRPLCAECDLALNDLVLRWMLDPQAEVKIAKYYRSLLKTEHKE